jgi:hypothetical protein
MGWNPSLPSVSSDEAATILSSFLCCHHHDVVEDDPEPAVAYERIRHSYGAGALGNDYCYFASNRGLICISGDRLRCSFFAYRVIARLCFGSDAGAVVAQQLPLFAGVVP